MAESSRDNPTNLPEAVAVALRTEFIARFFQDLEEGRSRSLREYLELFPRAEEIVAQEYLALHAAETLLGDAPETGPSDAAAPESGAPADPQRTRYQRIESLGAGGMGEVYLAQDTTLHREVAVKFARPGASELRTALLNEAVTAGRLNHPNIPPVHDLGVDGEGRVYYVMRRIEGQSLREVLLARLDDPTAWSLPKLLTMFQQACLALDYAHAQEVVHLDLKPENMMVGGFGELYLVDWGLSARFLRESQQRSEQAGPQVRAITGTPGYMSPEQANGRQDLGPASDVFSLGAMLYEIVCEERAFPAEPRKTLLDRIRDAAFEDGEAWESAPIELREICARALQKQPRRRQATAREIHDEVQTYLEGTREKQRRKKAALQALAAAEEFLAEHRERLREAEELELEVAAHKPQPWLPLSEKKEAWKLEDERDDCRRDAERAYDEATLRLAEAYRHTPQDLEVRERLGQHYWECFLKAEERSDRFQQSFFSDQLTRLDLDDYREALRGLGSLEIQCEPRPQKVTLRSVTSRNRVLRPSSPKKLEGNPVRVDSLPMGRWHITIERKGYVPVSAPLFIARGQPLTLRWRLRRQTEVGDGFVQIPPGPCLIGGDRETISSLPRQTRSVKEFCIARFPITVEEYIEFLQDVEAASPRSARKRLPRVARGGKHYGWLTTEGGIALVRHKGSYAHKKWPVFGISWFDAMAYARWRSDRDGRKYTLASDEEWEKAARGVDGRPFPWGDHYDATFCKNLDSTETKSQPEPIGKYRHDVSPYGVHDMAGGIKDWCRSWFSKTNNQRLIRGGSWNHNVVGARCAYRNGCPPDEIYPFLGFRLAHHYRKRP